MDRALMLVVAAITWPLWVPFIKAVVAEIRAADRSAQSPPAPPPKRRARLVNPGWDDAHLHAQRGARPGRARAARRAGR